MAHFFASAATVESRSHKNIVAMTDEDIDEFLPLGRRVIEDITLH